MAAKKEVRVRDISSGFIGWCADDSNARVQKQAAIICKKFNLTIDHWEGNIDQNKIWCYFTPEIPEQQADDFCEFVESLR